MTSFIKTGIFFLFFLLSAHSMEVVERNNEEINHQNLSRIFSENSNLFNSSVNKDIVVFLGNTGSGKSTLINFLSGKNLVVDQFNRIVLGEQNDPSSLPIGVTGASETLVPKFIEAENMTFFDLPGFRENRGTCHALLGACFLKNIIEKARTVKIIFVASQHSVTEDRGESAGNLLQIIENLIPNQNIKNSSSFVITKSDFEVDILSGFLGESTRGGRNENLFTPWVNLERLGKMSKPAQRLINQGDRQQILNLINRTPSNNIQRINVTHIYNNNNNNLIEIIYKNEIDNAVGLLINNNFNQNLLQSNNVVNLRNVKQYFDVRFLNEAILNIENSRLISLLRPISENLYTSALNTKRENISLKGREISGLIDRAIQQETIRQQNLERQRLEEQRRLQQIENQSQQEIIRQKDLERKRLEEECRKQQEIIHQQQLEQQRQQLERQRLEMELLKQTRNNNLRNITQVANGCWYSTEGGVAITDFNNKLFLTHQTREKNIAVGCTSDGNEWVNLYTGDWINLKKPVFWGSIDGGITIKGFNNKLFLAHEGRDTSMHLASSDDGKIWKYINSSSNAGSHAICGGISLETFNNKLFLAHVGRDKCIYFSSSIDGESWEKVKRIPESQINGISMASFNNKLFMAVQASADNRIWINWSKNGENWYGSEGSGPIPDFYSTDGGLALASFNNKLFLAYQGKDSNIYISFSNDGAVGNWSKPEYVGGSADGGISLASFNNKLFLVSQCYKGTSICISSTN